MAGSSTKFGVAIAVALLGIASPAFADTVANFTLDNVTLNDAGTATGGFTLDLTTDTLSNVNITTSEDDSYPLGTIYTSGTFSNSPGTFDFYSGVLFDYDVLQFTLPSALAATQLASSQNFAASGGESFVFIFCGGVCDSRSITGGTLDEVPAATPLPAALPMFAGGLGFVGFLARRKKRNALAAA